MLVEKIRKEAVIRYKNANSIFTISTLIPVIKNIKLN